MNSHFCVPAHAESRSCDARTTPPSFSATFANVLTIATDEDFDFPPPPPPPSVPPATIWCHQRNNSSSTANGTMVSPGLPSPPRLNVAAPVRHYHKHSASTSTTTTPTDGMHDSTRPTYFTSGPINFGRSQIFDEMDERVSRSRRVQHLGRQKQQKNALKEQFDEDSRRDTQNSLENSRHIYNSLNDRPNNASSVAVFRNLRQNNDSETSRPFSDTMRPDSKAFCESEDSALPESSVSMSPTNSSASTSSAGGAAGACFKWSKNERDKENLPQSAHYFPRENSSALRLPPASSDNTSEADSGVRNSFADSDDTGRGVSRLGIITTGSPSFKKSQFGYGRWVRTPNGKWQRVDDGKNSSELTRARSADRFISLPADSFKIEGIFKKHTRQYKAPFESLSTAPRLLQRANTDDVWLHAQRDTNADVWQRSDKLTTSNKTRNLNQSFSNAAHDEINKQDVKVEQIRHKSNGTNCHKDVNSRMYANARPIVTIDVQPTIINGAEQDKNKNIQPGVMAGILTTGAVVSTLRTTIVEKADVLPERLHEHAYDIVADSKFLPSDNNQEVQSFDENNNNNLKIDSNNNTSLKNMHNKDYNVWQRAEAVSETAHILSIDKEDRALPSLTLHSNRTDTSFNNNNNNNNNAVDGNKGDVSFDQLANIHEWLGTNDFARYNIFGVSLQRNAGVEDGSVGLILTSALADLARLHTGDEYITIQRVITGSIADYDERLERGDRVFYIQNRLTRHMSAAEARKILKSPAATVTLIVGRLINANFSAVYSRSTALDTTVSNSTTQAESFNGDPALECYDTETIKIALYKTELGVGLALDGGRGCKYGDRNIIARKVFAVGSAARDGRIQAGDEICAIDGCSLVGKTQLEAWKILKARPEGMVSLEIRKRIAPLR